MMEFADASPTVQVDQAEYSRLLGYPRGHVLAGRSLELAEESREWYAAHGRPWIYVRQTNRLELADGSVRIDGVPFTTRRLQKTLQKAEAHSVFLVAATAGPEAEEQANLLWREDKPDEYFFLEVFGSAVVEHLFAAAGARLCAWADERQMAVLPHSSPGYSQWDISEQVSLLRLIQSGAVALPGKLEALSSGALLPKKSQLGVFGLTRHTGNVRRLSGLIPCQDCSFSPCQFRRVPYRKSCSIPELDSTPEASRDRDRAATVRERSAKS
jgi:hypothetical protein